MTARRTLLGKFLSILAPIFLVCVIAGLWVLTEYRLRDLLSHVTSRVGVQAAQVAGLLNDPDLRADRNLSSQLLTTLMTDRAILCAEVRDAKGAAALSAPRKVGCLGQPAGENLTIPLEDDGALTVRFSLQEISLARREAREFGVIILFSSLLFAIIAATFGFRRIVSSPLNRLLNAIRATAESGEFCKVDRSTNDDLGEVINAFNRMQQQSSTERKALSKTLDRINGIYDRTPTPLFVIDQAGQILSASSHFGELTGYRNEALAGRAFSLLLSGNSRQRFEDSVLPELARKGSVREVPLQIWSSLGDETHVLLSAAVEDPSRTDERQYLCVMADVTLLRHAELRLKDLAVTDHLTGLLNRVGLSEEIERTLTKGNDDFRMVAVLMIDLDNFKWINDTYGHASGDALLMEMATRFNDVLRPGEIVARLGGDEFAIVCQNIVCLKRAEEIAQSIIDRCAEPVDLDGREGMVHASIGIAIAFPGKDTPNEALRRADLAMYQAKQDGRNRYCVFAGNDLVATQSKAEQMADIRRGLEEDWFSLVYQPLVDLATNRVIGAEVLLRLSPPERPAPPIQQIINLAEETGQIDLIGEWVLKNAAQQFKELRRISADPTFYITINVSVRQFTESFLHLLKRTITRHPELADHLVVEITETSMMKRFDVVAEHIKEMKSYGIKIAIDDFGTGYSSLSYISRLPIDILKLDRSLASNLGEPSLPLDERRKRQALVKATAILARDLGVRLVAEGIETPDDAAILLSLGVEIGQGYLFSRPLPREAFRDWFALFGAPKKAAASYPPHLKVVG